MKKTHSLALAAGGIALAGWAASRAFAQQFSFGGKVVVITGGSRGLGFTLAKQICAEGGRAVLLARDKVELQSAHDELAREGGEVSILPIDLLDTAQIKSAVETIIDRLGRIDVLINNAGIIEVGPVEHMQRDDFERAMQLHLWAPFTLMTEVIPWMKRNRGGRIVNISSIGGKVAVPHLAPYSASKFALTGLSDSFRAELARDRIYITTVWPGLMRTGSHVNAQFKGKHAEEFAWFALGIGMPFTSMNVERAAAKILDACRRGQPALTLTLPAKLAIAANGVVPNLVAHATSLTNRLLPDATDSSGDTLRSGGQSRSEKLTPRWLTWLADRAISRTNQPHGTAAP
ncbi:MAG TPA: SDR family oxidoreductase [Chthoniobacterales bacterium]